MSQIFTNKPEGIATNNNIKDIDSFFNKFIVEDKTTNFYLIVPTGKLTRHLIKYYISLYWKHHKKPTEKPNIFTIQGFANTLFKELNFTAKKNVISDSYQFILFKNVFDKLNEDKYFAKFKSNYEFVHTLYKFIKGLREKSSLSQSQKEHFKIVDKDKFELISDLYFEYDKALSNDYDYSKVLNELSKDINFDKCSNFFQNKELVFIYGFTDFNLPEINFFTKLAEQEIEVSFSLNYNSNNSQLFKNLINISKTLIEHKFKHTNKEDLNLFNSNDIETNLSELNQNLFKKKSNSLTQISKYIKVIEYKNIEEEIEDIVKIVKYLYLKENTPLSDIFIAFRNSDKYSLRLRENFIKNEIPCNVTDRFKLNRSTVVISLLNSLKFYINNYDVKLLLNSLNSNFIKYKGFDKSRVFTEIRHLHKELKISAKSIKKENDLLCSIDKKLNEDPLEFDSVNYFSKKIRYVSSFYKNILELYSEFKLEMTANEFYLAVCNLIDKLGIKSAIFELLKNKSNLTNFEKEFYTNEVEINFRALSAFYSVLSELVDNLRTHNSPETKYETAYLFDMLTVGISEKRYQMQEKQNYGVTITTIEQTRYLPIKVMILCGAGSNDLPLPYSSDKLMGMELIESETKHISNEKIKFLQILNNFTEIEKISEKQIYITYHKHYGKSQVNMSHFVKSLTYNSSQPILYTSNPNQDNKFELNQDLLAWNKFDLTKSINLNNITFNANVNFSFIEPQTDIHYKEKVENHKYSPSSLNKFLECEYRAYLHSIFGLNELNLKNTSKLEKYEIGNLLHFIFNEFYSSLESDSIEINNKTFKPKTIKPEHKEKFLSIAEKYFSFYENDNIEMKYIREELFGTLLHKSIFEQWFNFELENAEQFKPALFEENFGKDNFLTLDNGDFKFNVNLKIDRIDINQETNELRIIDYKTKTDKNLDNKVYINKFKNSKDTFDNKDIQLPIYTLAVNEFFKNSNLKVVNAQFRYIYKNEITANTDLVLAKGIESNHYEFILDSPIKPKVKSNVIEEALATINEKFLHLNSKEISITPNTNCQYCDYKSICRKNEFIAEVEEFEFDENEYIV